MDIKYLTFWSNIVIVKLMEGVIPVPSQLAGSESMRAFYFFGKRIFNEYCEYNYKW